jgi:hypothetical protein
LPPGIHPATMEELGARFGQESELRRAQMESLRWLVDLGWRAGALRIVVNGSFVTDKLDPNDVDCVLLIGTDFPQDAVAEAELLAGLPDPCGVRRRGLCSRGLTSRRINVQPAGTQPADLWTVTPTHTFISPGTENQHRSNGSEPDT